MDCFCFSGKGAVYSFDPVGSYQRDTYKAGGSASAMLQPLLDNQVKKQRGISSASLSFKDFVPPEAPLSNGLYCNPTAQYDLNVCVFKRKKGKKSDVLFGGFKATLDILVA